MGGARAEGNGSSDAPDASKPDAAEGGSPDIPVENQGGASGASPQGGSGESSGAPASGTGGEPTSGDDGSGDAPSMGGTGGQPTTPPDDDGCSPPAGELTGLHLTGIARGLPELTYITAAPGDDTRLFVLERPGVVRVLENGVPVPVPFLDLTPRVSTSNEEGLVGLAFHPSYVENGRLFVQYASTELGNDGAQRIILSEFSRSKTNSREADPASERVLMVVEQPSDIHLAGMLAFGLDGSLYVSRGDGGSHDSHELDSWLGKMLRIDVDTTSADRPYGIPAGNMTGPGVLPEIWSRGWRNPWRFSFDACTGDIYVGDVGEATREEVDFEPRNTPGRDYGWRTLEGSLCFSDSDAGAPASCDASGLTPPVLEYEHTEIGCSVISGYVYRGKRIPALRGTYLYADFCTGYFGSLRIENGQAVAQRDITSDLNTAGATFVTSFGVDNAGEMYVVTFLGDVFRIDPD